MRSADIGDNTVSHHIVRGVVVNAFGNTNMEALENKTDFFAFGLDFHGVVPLLHALHGLGFDWVDSSTIYKYPTINSLTERLRRGKDDNPLDPALATMFGLIDKYSHIPTLEALDGVAPCGNFTPLFVTL